MTQINIEEILPFVRRPTRYIGGELNAVGADQWDKKFVKIVLAFPDVYEIGMSNLGLKIIYEIVNNTDFALAERVFSPWVDLEQILRKKQMPLFSLESKRPLREFDIIGFSLQYELSYTNVLNILDLAKIPLRSKDRDENHPLIIGGGPCSFNPEPLADFIDLFIIGDAEEVIQEIIEVYKNYKLQITNHKFQKEDKVKLLKNMAKIDGVYVPSFYEVKYNDDGTIKSIKSKVKGVADRIKKRTVDINRFNYPVKPPVPFMDVVHNRLTLEIMRGCGRGCRFCQAGVIYGPRREKNIENLINLAKENIKNTGYEEVSLSSLSSTDYSKIEQLIYNLQKELENNKVSISLPSIRPNNFSLNVAEALCKVKKTGLTFAPEAGTQRLRNTINKNITNEDVISTVGKVYSSGWKLVKLYFMFGLPTETPEDIEGIIDLVNKIKALYKHLNINITLSAFVPKPHTPFQWAKQENINKLIDKKIYLTKNLKGTVKWHRIETSFLEAVFARGDRRLANVLENAWHKGCKFDGWDEHFKFELWMKAFEEAGIAPGFYANREIEIEETLPWEHIESGTSKEFLLKEYKKALSVKITPSRNQLVLDRTPEELKVNIESHFHKKMPCKNAPVVQKIRVKYSKKGILRFISHLELASTIIRALRRMDICLAYSEGFTQHPKISFGSPLPVGIKSETEYFDVQLITRYDVCKFIKRLNEYMPQDIIILDAKEVPVSVSSLIDTVFYAEYEVSDINRLINTDELKKVVDNFLQLEEFVIEKPTKKGIKEIDIRKSILGLRLKDARTLFLSLKMDNHQGIRPDIVIQKIFKLNDTKVGHLNIRRVNLLTQDKKDLFCVSNNFERELLYAERNIY